jgi:hypothetical protein
MPFYIIHAPSDIGSYAERYRRNVTRLDLDRQRAGSQLQ